MAVNFSPKLQRLTRGAGAVRWVCSTGPRSRRRGDAGTVQQVRINTGGLLVVSARDPRVRPES